MAKTPTPPFIIAVWNHPLINWYSQEPLKINLGQVIPFNASYSSHIPSWQGWSEPDLTGTWSVGKTAVLNLALNHTSSINQDLKLFIVGQTCLTTLHPKQEVDVWVNHQYLTTWVYTPEKNDGVRTVILPKALVETSHGNLTIKFSFHQAISPAEVGYSDKRNLGMLLRFIEVVPVTPAH